MRYLINLGNYFFAIEDDVSLNTRLLEGCELLPTKEAMYQRLDEIAGMPLEDVEGLEMVIKYNPYGRLVNVDDRGGVEYIEDTVEFQRGGIEEYLTDYVL